MGEGQTGVCLFFFVAYVLLEVIRKVLFMKGDLQITPTTEPKTTDFQ